MKRAMKRLGMTLAITTVVTIPLFSSSAHVGAAPMGLGGVVQVVGSYPGSFCALLTSGGVDCWGQGGNGELGNGTFYTTGQEGSPFPVQVVGVGGTGILSGVVSLTDGPSEGGGYCALLHSGGVDCWGYGQQGELGDDAFTNSAVPVRVVGVGGTGTLSGVASLSTGSGGNYSALLTSGGVDCWGSGQNGQLGERHLLHDGERRKRHSRPGGGCGWHRHPLGGCVKLTTKREAAGCALLTSGGVDCWGFGALRRARERNLLLGERRKRRSRSGGGCGRHRHPLGGGVVHPWGRRVLPRSSPRAGWTAGGMDQQGEWATIVPPIVPSPVRVVGVGGTSTLSGVESLEAPTGALRAPF